MGLLDRISRVFRANLNDMVNQAEDPEKILEQAVVDMQEDLVQLRKAVAKALAEKKRTEQRYNQNISEASKWESRAKLALSKSDENLAREALTRKKTLTDTATMLKQQLDQQAGQTEVLQRNLMALESKISEAKTKKNMLQARAKSAKASQELQQTLGGIDTSSSMSAFERMETKVLDMEAESQAVAELGGFGIEQQFAELEASSGVDDELAMLKAQMNPEALPASAPPKQLPESETGSDTVVDAELEEIRSQLKDV